MRTEGRKNLKKGLVIRIKNYKRHLLKCLLCGTGRYPQEVIFPECIRRMPEMQAKILSVADVEDNTESSKRHWEVFRIQE